MVGIYGWLLLVESIGVLLSCFLFRYVFLDINGMVIYVFSYGIIILIKCSKYIDMGVFVFEDFYVCYF